MESPHCICSSVVASMRPSVPPPQALFTSTSTVPQASSAPPPWHTTSSFVLASLWTKRTSAPNSSRQAAATSSPLSSSISATSTLAPSWAKRRTTPRPIPSPPPVTIATLSRSRSVMAPSVATVRPWRQPQRVCPISRAAGRNGAADSAAGVERPSAAPPSRAGTVASSRCATRWRSIPSMCAATARSEHGPPLGRQDDMDAAAVVRAVLPRHQARLDHAVDQAGHPACRQGDVGAEPAHGQPAVGSAPTWMRTSKNTRGIPTYCSSSRPRVSVNRRCVRTIRPMSRMRSSSIWPRTPQAPPLSAGRPRHRPARTLVAPAPRSVTARRRDGRRSHVVSPQSPPKSHCNLLVYLIDKYL